MNNIPLSNPEEGFSHFWRKLNPPDHLIYCAYDKDERLIYVGITSRLRTRFKEHFFQSAWIGEVESIEISGPCSKLAAQEMESNIISEKRPLYNQSPGHRVKSSPATWSPRPSGSARGKLSVEDRYNLVSRAQGGEKVLALAREFGISRVRVYQIIDELTDTGKLSRLEDELAFRRYIIKNLEKRSKKQPSSS